MPLSPTQVSGLSLDYKIDSNASEDSSIKKIRSVSGSDSLESSGLHAFRQCNRDQDAGANLIIDTPPVTVKRTITSTGARILAQIKEEKTDEVEEVELLHGLKRKIEVKKVPNLDVDRVSAKEVGSNPPKVNRPRALLTHEQIKKMSFEEFLRATDAEDERKEIERPEEAQGHHGLKEKIKVKEELDVGLLGSDSIGSLIKRPPDEFLESSDDFIKPKRAKVKSEDEYDREKSEWYPGLKENIQIKEELDATLLGSDSARDEIPRMRADSFVQSRNGKVKSEGSGCIIQCVPNHNPQKPYNLKKETTLLPYGNPQKNFNVKKGTVGDRPDTSVLVEDWDFPAEPDWLLVGRTPIIGISTTKGRKLVDNEIVHFSFPSADLRNKCNSKWGLKAASVASSIVRFSTKRSGEIGRLPMEWTKCIIPLVNSSKVKVLGRCVAAPVILSLMQEIVLYVSFYIHQSVFNEGDKSSWKLDATTNIDSTVYPLPTLFKLLKIEPFQEAEFTPEELDSRSSRLNLEGDADEAPTMFPIVIRKKNCEQFPGQNNDEEVISESSLNKLVGAADLYNLEEMEPPRTLMCDLRSYQKQALFWMSQLEKGSDAENAPKTLHPCWAAYQICDERASAIYVNTFSGEATTQLPTAIQMSRGGILGDAMGLGKTVMTIALILARPGRRSCGVQKGLTDAANDSEDSGQNYDSHPKAPLKVRGGTLIVCPMALLSQWKDELETHSRPESISIFIHYGGDKTNDPKVMSEHDVVLTTYGVLTSAHKNDANNSIFHRVEWYRVVLDEAHTIKSSKTFVAQAAFALLSHCRWCLTGTPLQNNLEDLYSLLCFLHVQPWCNWAWWYKLIQKPYECGDQRGLRLIKAILRPLMLRRTKDTKDKEGRPILILPPTDIQVIECEQSEAEHDFYDVLFKRSKVQFDQLVEQGRVLHNYASILELLLRLRQCCNHPFLVMSRGDTQQYANLNKLARKFLEKDPYSDPANHMLPTRAFVEDVVEGIRRGENTECPICLESADDPVLTPCAHLMCRECLLSSWRTPMNGLCPICRKLVKRTDLITCPSENRFRIDVEKNWKESSKISELMRWLEHISQSGTGEKSIVFSQWTSFLDLLEISLRRRRIGFLRYDGKLVQKQRERILKEFSETNEKMVLLMSLRAGGVGLNLTAASNVFLMDPWWNPAVEEQAIMRIHRIGQQRTVHVRRFIVKDTVEERMQQVQARKQRMITGALTEEEVRTARIEELKMLFR